MSSGVSSLIQEVLRGVLLRLALMVGGRLGLRVRLLRLAMLGLPEGRRRRAIARDIARLERVLALLSDPELMADARFMAMAAEAAICGADPGRRAWVRLRWIYGWGWRRRRWMRAFVRAGADGALEVARSRCALA